MSEASKIFVGNVVGQRVGPRFVVALGARPQVEESRSFYGVPMQIEIYPPMPSRPCRFCLCLQDGSVFADFDVDADGCVFAVRVSFDGFGCCHAPTEIGRMNAKDSHALLAMIERSDIGEGAEEALRTYFKANHAWLWRDALERHDLI